ncbi:MAG: cyclase family protein [Candidatus Caldarchaeum sp.]|nr:cyclase family protein [Candidatus Caldarchaeum sp.]
MSKQSIVWDWSKIKIYDLSQPTSPKAPPFMYYPPFKVTWIKRLGEHNVNAQYIEGPLHTGTHFDGQLHFMTGGKDIASIDINYFIGEGVIVDISKYVGDYDIYTSEIVERAAKEAGLEIKPDDILIIHTGYHRYAWCGPEPDEVRYMCKHPGPTAEFARWCIQKKIRWLGIDAMSQDHPFNTVIRRARPDLVTEAEKKWGKKIDELMPWPENYQVMHIALFPKMILHVENLGGEIAKVANRRCLIMALPFKFDGGETAYCRAIAITSE